MLSSLAAITAPDNRPRLAWAVRVRWLVIAGFFALALLAHATGLLASLAPCVRAAVAAAILNAVNDWCVRRGRFLRLATALAVPGDVVLITYLTLHTGGVQSPFVMMYVVQVVATAMLVGLDVAAVCAVGSAGGFAAAVLLQRAGVVAGAELGGSGVADAATYQLVWALFLLYCLALMAYVGGYVSEQLRGRERELAAANSDLRRTLASLEQAHADLIRTDGLLRAAESQLVHSEKMRALGEFVAGIAHELNNPLAFVAGNIDHLERALPGLAEMLGAYGNARAAEPGLAARRRELRVDEFLDDLPSVVRDCQEGVRRATEIVTALRIFARGGSASETWDVIDLHESLDRTLALLRHRLADGPAVEREYRALPPVECLPGQLDQVFVNLVANAIDAVDGSGRIRIETRPVEVPPPGLTAPCVAVVIADNGAGMAEEVRAHVFEPFFTTKPAGQGTGLGLSVSYGIVARHGGAIHVESAPGAGSAFTVFLPVRQPRVSPAATGA